MAIITEESTFLSTNKKTAIHYSLWIPENQRPAGIVQLVHGMQEHIGRYRDLAEFLAKHGFVVGGHDHLGHGLSVTQDRDWGFFAPLDGDRLLVEDVKPLNTLLRSRFPGLPLILLGHSMGSFVTRDYLARYGATADAYICSGTGGPDLKVGFGISMANASVRRHGPRYIDQNLRKLATGGNNARIKNPRTSNDWLSRDEAVVDRYNADPFTTHPFTNSAYRDLFTLYRRINLKSSFARIPKDMPILMIAGAEDPVGSYGAGVKKAHQRFLQAGVKRVSLKLYPGHRHECHNELGYQAVYDDILAFLREISSAHHAEKP